MLVSEDVGIWEGVARDFHESTGIGAPVSAFDVAAALDLPCIPDARGSAWLDAAGIHYDPTARHVRQHGNVVHESAHVLLDAAKVELPDDPEETAVKYTAGAVMLPRVQFSQDVRATAWDLDQLRLRHPNASAEMIARRLTQVREAVITVFDQGRVHRRIASPGMAAPQRVTPIELELADAALGHGKPARANALLGAWPLLDGRHRRVVVIAEARQLALRP